MKLNIYAIYDKKIGAYMTPFFSHNHGTALRSVRVACANDQSPFFHNPEDYSLSVLGSFNDELGVIEPHAPQIIAQLDQLELSND